MHNYALFKIFRSVNLDNRLLASLISNGKTYHVEPLSIIQMAPPALMFPILEAGLKKASNNDSEGRKLLLSFWNEKQGRENLKNKQLKGGSKKKKILPFSCKY